MSYQREYLALTDEVLLTQCDVHIYKSSGPGGQHRNKVSTAVRIKHRPTGVTAHGDESRSQHQNKRMALRRVRMKIASQIRRPVELRDPDLPTVVEQCMFRPGRSTSSASRCLRVGRKDHRFWYVAAFLLDVLDAFEGRLTDAGGYIGITLGNLTRVFKSDRHVFAAAQGIRKRFGRKPLR